MLLRPTIHSRFVAALHGLRHILPSLRYGKTSHTPGKLVATSAMALRASLVMLGVSLEKNQYLHTYNPTNPIKFWHYKPQGEYDAAPRTINRGFA